MACDPVAQAALLNLAKSFRQAGQLKPETHQQLRAVLNGQTDSKKSDPTLMLTKKQLANRLRVSERSIERWTRRGLITAHHLGPRLVRYRLTDVEQLIADAVGTMEGGAE